MFENSNATGASNALRGGLKSSTRAWLLAGVALGFVTPALAQETAPQAAASSELELEAIVVTGSRIVRDGYEAPTPVSVVTAIEIAKSAPITIADYVNQMPALSGSTTPRTGQALVGNGTAGANLLNLRNLGPNRTLTLLNGRRVTPSMLTGAVDVNTMPTALVQRVDVVTGGASAAWGSDAVAGVVNFVLDTKFSGLKGEVQGGGTTHGDGGNWSGNLAGGTSFAGGRGHIVAAANYSKAKKALAEDRDWFKGHKVVPNPMAAAAGQPARLLLPGTSLNVSSGGLVTSGPLRGVHFDAAGNYDRTPFNFGTESGIYAIGGDQDDYSGRTAEIAQPLEQGSVFTHVSYELTDRINVFGEFAYGDSHAINHSGPFFRTSGQYTVRTDNAYLSPAVKAMADAAGINSFGMGFTGERYGRPQGVNDRSVTRYMGGFDGDLGEDWRVSGYGQHGVAKVRNAVTNNPILSRFAQATDAVVNPATGAIVCRSTLSNPGNGCVPLNPFGTAAPTAEQRAYIWSRAEQNIRIQQDVFALDFSGSVPALEAGDLALAFGAEYRKEKGEADADPVSQATQFYVANYKPFSGAYDVKEAYAELSLPILRDSAFGRSLELNAAGRVADYSESGQVETWKVGGTYRPIDEVQFRVTRSRDIRAPNLNDMFLGGATVLTNFVDPFRNNEAVQVNVTTAGNRALKPEIANTLTGGVVYQPDWLPSFSVSLDVYDIKIKEAIATSSIQQMVNACFAGDQALCSFISRDPVTGRVNGGRVVPFNQRSEEARGLDIEVGYRTDLGEGSLDLRGMLNYVDKLNINSAVARVTRAGEVGTNLGAAQGVPHWRGLFTAGYSLDPIDFQLKARFIGASKIEADYGPRDINRNKVPAIVYLDAFFGWTLPVAEGTTQLFVGVENLLDQNPPISQSQDNSTCCSSGANPFVYDLIGRSIRGGIRFRF